VRQLENVARDLNISLATLSIAWCIKNPNVTTAILGATKKEQLLENLKALDVLPALKPEVMNRIDEVMQTKPKLAEY
jgi:aryl-alcohol dehydrogenase-like predicted oxidoreductase